MVIVVDAQCCVSLIMASPILCLFQFLGLFFNICIMIILILRCLFSIFFSISNTLSQPEQAKGSFVYTATADDPIRAHCLQRFYTRHV